MGTKFKYVIIGMMLLSACVTHAASLSPYGSTQPIFTSSSSLLHDSNRGKAGSLLRTQHRYAPLSSPASSSYKGYAPSMTSMSTASCSFRSNTPVILAANGNVHDNTIRLVGEDEDLPDPFPTPAGNVPYFLTAILAAVYAIRKRKQSNNA